MPTANVNYRIIGLNVSTYRYARNLTQAQLAEKAGVSKQFICNIECGRAIPSLQTLMSLCFALDVTSEDLLRCSSTYNPEAPCTLREDQNVLTDTLSERLFPESLEVRYISPDALPVFDVILPDPDDMFSGF